MSTRSRIERLEQKVRAGKTPSAERYQGALARLTRTYLNTRVASLCTALAAGLEPPELAGREAKDARVIAAWSAAHFSPEQIAATRKGLIERLNRSIAEAKEWLSRPVEPEVMRPIVSVEAPGRAPVEGRVINSEPIRKRLSDGMPAGVEAETQRRNEEQLLKKQRDAFRAVAWPEPMPGVQFPIQDEDRKW